MNRERALRRVAELEHAIRAATGALTSDVVILNDDAEFQVLRPSEVMPGDRVIVKARLNLGDAA